MISVYLPIMAKDPSAGAFGDRRITKSLKCADDTERPAGARDNAEVHNMDRPNEKWESADWENGNVFNCAWKASNISFQDGIMSIVLKKEASGKYPYTSGEYRSTKEYHYGRYETRMKAASGNGLVTSFFTYTGDHGTSNHHEIDIEILGKDPRQMQLNYFVEGKETKSPDDENTNGQKTGETKKIVIALPFDASQGFHNYGFEWKKDSIEWFVDGVSVYKVEGKVPYLKGKIMANLWPGTTEVSRWLGGVYEGKGTAAQYDWISHEPEVKNTP